MKLCKLYLFKILIIYNFKILNKYNSFEISLTNIINEQNNPIAGDFLGAAQSPVSLNATTHQDVLMFSSTWTPLYCQFVQAHACMLKQFAFSWLLFKGKLVPYPFHITGKPSCHLSYAESPTTQ